MSKQVELLTLTKSETSKKTTSSNSAKKEGMSLFDSLLTKSKDDVKTNNQNNDNSTNKKTEKSNNQTNNTQTSKSTDNRDVELKQNTRTETSTKNETQDTKNEPQTNKTQNTKENINSEEKSSEKDTTTTKKQSSGLSLLDKLVLDAKKQAGITETSEVETGETSETLETSDLDTDLETGENTEDKKIKAKKSETSDLDENKIKSNSLLDEVLNSDTETEEISTTDDKKEKLKNLDSQIASKTLQTEDTNVELDENIKTDTKSETKTVPEIKVENANQAKENIKVDTKSDDKSISKDLKLETVDKKTIQNQNTIQTNLDEEATDSLEQSEETTNSKKLTSLDKEAVVKDEKRVNIDKNILSDTKKDGSSIENKIEDTTLTKAQNLEQETQKQTSAQKSNDLVTNIYLSSQKGSLLSQMTMNQSEGLKVVKEGSSLTDIQEGANILDLGLEGMDVDVEESSNENTFTQQMKRRVDNNLSILNKLALDTSNQEPVVEDDAQTSQTNSSSSTTSSSNETNVNLAVNSNLALSIQNRIIGARQSMSSMMSDIARNMYDNYKPPVTAFRINLIPAQLGHIAILMKNDKDNSLSISLTMSQSSTHDAMVDNQNTLKDALSRTFNNNQASFNLDFNMEGNETNSNSNSSYSDQENQAQNNNKTHSSGEIVESIIQNQDVAEDMNYM